MPFIASCYRSGEILIGRKCPKTAIPLASGPERLLQNAVEGAARLAYDNKTWLVPGVPEASDEEAAIEAAARFAAALKLRLENQNNRAAAQQEDAHKREES